MREYFVLQCRQKLIMFRFLKKHTIDEDLNHRIKLLSNLTENGKDILHFEEEVTITNKSFY